MGSFEWQNAKRTENIKKNNVREILDGFEGQLTTILMYGVNVDNIGMVMSDLKIGLDGVIAKITNDINAKLELENYLDEREIERERETMGYNAPKSQDDGDEKDDDELENEDWEEKYTEELDRYSKAHSDSYSDNTDPYVERTYIPPRQR